MKVVGNTGWQERLVSRRQTQSRPMDVMRDGLLAIHSAVRVLRSKPANIDTNVESSRECSQDSGRLGFLIVARATVR